MTKKTAVVTSRMKKGVKEEAEATLPSFPPIRAEMGDKDFDKMMTKGLEQAKRGESYDADEVFDELEK